MRCGRFVLDRLGGYQGTGAQGGVLPAEIQRDSTINVPVQAFTGSVSSGARSLITSAANQMTNQISVVLD